MVGDKSKKNKRRDRHDEDRGKQSESQKAQVGKNVMFVATEVAMYG